MSVLNVGANGIERTITVFYGDGSKKIFSFDIFDEAEIVKVKGWKSKDKISIIERRKIFKVVEHRKEKHTGIVKPIVHIIPRENVSGLFEIVKDFKIGTKHKAREIWKKLIVKNKIHKIQRISVRKMVESFNGGTNRSKWYFPLYYYPMKILEKKKYITFLGSGKCIRKKEGWLL